jgi:hypothetical protein
MMGWNYFYSIFNYYFNLACPKVRRNIVSSLNFPCINKDVIAARTKQKNLYDLCMQSKIQSIEISIKHIKRNMLL